MSRAETADLAARRRADRAARRRVVLVVVGVLVAVLGLAGWVLLGSPWLRVEHVRVTGVHRADEQVVGRATGSLRGKPLVLVSGRDLERRMASERYVAGVRVSRDWPDTVRVRVTERVPVAAVPGAAGGGFTLIDEDAVALAEVHRVPAHVARVSAAVAKGGHAAVDRALTAVSALSGSGARVAEVVTATPVDVRLRLTNGATVRWGGPEQSEEKARVLHDLLRHGARSYDVSVPSAPAVG